MKNLKRILPFFLYKVLLLVLFFSPVITLSQVKSGKIIIGEKITIYSKVLNENRTILIRIPKDYDKSGKKYPVMYLLDGEFFFQQASAAVNFLSECGYIKNKPVPEMIVVGIVNVDRNRDYTPTYAPEQLRVLRYPTSGKSEKFLEHLVSEVFPLIESKYRTQPFRLLSGWSFGGLFAVTTFFEHPECFSAYLAISPSLWWDEDMYLKKAESFLERRQITDKPLTVTLGALEGGNMDRSVRQGFVPLLKKWSVSDRTFKYIEIPGEGHSYVPYKALYEGLLSIFSDWIIPNDLLGREFEEIASFYNNLSEKYGYQIEIPESTYSGHANILSQNGKKEEALQTAKEYVKKYPQSSYAYFCLGERYYSIEKYKEAKKCFEKALETENSQDEPDSEKIVVYKIRLQDVKEEINKSDKK